MNRRGGGNVPSSLSSPTTTSPASSTDSSGDRKRKAEVIDLLDDDDDDETEETSREKKKRQQEESDAALARRLSLQQDNQAAPPKYNAAGLSRDYDDGFHKLASIVLFQLISRHDAAAALQRVSAQCGGQMTPRSVVKLGTEGLARILGEEKKAKKANAIIDLARKWSTLPSCPKASKGPCSAADKHFVTAVTKSPKNGGVAGIGKWTLHTFLEDLGRTDILNADCYEVQQGVRWFTGADKRSAASVREFGNDQNFRPHSLTQVSAIMRNLHRAVQVILGFGPKKRKTPNAEDRIKIQKAIAHTRKELEGL
jgi:3-methyladenine DNA glycosylase/8-oxoguanine DNA glycosylase